MARIIVVLATVSSTFDPVWDVHAAKTPTVIKAKATAIGFLIKFLLQEYSYNNIINDCYGNSIDTHALF